MSSTKKSLQTYRSLCEPVTTLREEEEFTARFERQFALQGSQKRQTDRKAPMQIEPNLKLALWAFIVLLSAMKASQIRIGSISRLFNEPPPSTAAEVRYGTR
jgi:hypothetical protein